MNHYDRIQIVRSARHNFWTARYRQWRRELLYWSLALLVSCLVWCAIIEIWFRSH